LLVRALAVAGHSSGQLDVIIVVIVAWASGAAFCHPLASRLWRRSLAPPQAVHHVIVRISRGVLCRGIIVSSSSSIIVCVIISARRLEIVYLLPY
jgi:hypothetical protein